MSNEITFKVSASKFGDKPAIHIECVGLNGIAVGFLRSHIYKNMIDVADNAVDVTDYVADYEYMLQIDCFPRTDKGAAAVVDLLKNYRTSEKPGAHVILQNASGGPLDVEALKAAFTELQQQGKGSQVGTPG